MIAEGVNVCKWLIIKGRGPRNIFYNRKDRPAIRHCCAGGRARSGGSNRMHSQSVRKSVFPCHDPAFWDDTLFQA
jgi:hypothetical protein